MVGYNFRMDYKFYETVRVRFGDLDPQGHVNNAQFLTFIEQARFAYLIKLGLFDGRTFIDLGWIVADVHIAFRSPIFMNQTVRVGARVTRLGNKSLSFSHQIEDEQTGQVLAQAEVVMVSFDYHTHTSGPIPETWRQTIADFEGIAPYPNNVEPRKE